jgi:hypothetical protein
MKRFIASLLFVCASAYAQDRYILSGAATIGASDYTITIRQPASDGKRVEIESITVQAVGGEVTVAVERNCSSVTTSSAATVRVVNPDTAPSPQPANKFQAYLNSGASGCSTFNDFDSQKGWKVPDRAMLPIPSLGTFIQGDGTAKNITIRLSGDGFIALWQIIVRENR